jgi:hypothetical protein
VQRNGVEAAVYSRGRGAHGPSAGHVHSTSSNAAFRVHAKDCNRNNPLHGVRRRSVHPAVPMIPVNRITLRDLPHTCLAIAFGSRTAGGRGGRFAATVRIRQHRAEPRPAPGPASDRTAALGPGDGQKRGFRHERVPRKGDIYG